MGSIDILWIVGSVVVEAGLMWLLYRLGSGGKTGAKEIGIVVAVAIPVMFLLAPMVAHFALLKMGRYMDFRHMLVVEVIAGGAVMLMFSVTSLKRSAVFVGVFCAIHAVATFALSAHFSRAYTPLQVYVRSLAERAAGRAHLNPVQRQSFEGMSTIQRKDWDAGGGRGARK